MVHKLLGEAEPEVISDYGISGVPQILPLEVLTYWKVAVQVNLFQASWNRRIHFIEPVTLSTRQC